MKTTISRVNINNLELLHTAFEDYLKLYNDVEDKTEEQIIQLATKLLEDCYNNGWVYWDYQDYSALWNDIIKNPALIASCTLQECIILLTWVQRESFSSGSQHTLITRTQDEILPRLVKQVYFQSSEQLRIANE